MKKKILPDAFDGVLNELGDTTLMGACCHSFMDLPYVQRLVEQKALINQQNLAGYTALMYATDRGHVDVVKFLIAQRASLDLTASKMDYNNTLYFARATNRVAIAELLLQAKIAIDYQNCKGKTVLMQVTIAGHLDLVNCLLKHKANLDIKDKNGNTAFVHAICNNRLEILAVLLQALRAKLSSPKKIKRQFLEKAMSAYLNEIYSDGDTTLLMRAAGINNASMVKLLLDAKANPHIRNKSDQFAMTFTRNKEIVDLLFSTYPSREAQQLANSLGARDKKLEITPKTLASSVSSSNAISKKVKKPKKTKPCSDIKKSSPQKSPVNLADEILFSLRNQITALIKAFIEKLNQLELLFATIQTKKKRYQEIASDMYCDMKKLQHSQQKATQPSSTSLPFYQQEVTCYQQIMQVVEVFNTICGSDSSNKLEFSMSAPLARHWLMSLNKLTLADLQQAIFTLLGSESLIDTRRIGNNLFDALPNLATELTEVVKQVESDIVSIEKSWGMVKTAVAEESSCQFWKKKGKTAANTSVKKLEEVKARSKGRVFG